MSEFQPISAFAKVRRGASPRPINNPDFFGGDVGWVRISDVTQRNKKFLRKTQQYLSPLGQSRSLRVDAGDLIMSICATVGKPMIVDMPACIHDGFVQIYDIQNANTEYLYYLLQFHEKDFEKRGQPGTQVNLNTTIVESEVVFIPSLSQQQKIAKILSTVDKLIEKTQTLIDKYTAIKQGMMADLFTRGIDLTTEQLRPSVEDAPELYKQTEMGWVPKEWKVRSVGEIAEVTKLAGFEFTQYFNYAEGGEIIALRAMNIKNEKIDITNIQKIGKSVSDKLPRSKLHVGDIVFTYIGAYIGDAAIIDENDKYHLAPNVCLIRPLQSKSAFFLFKQLRSEPLYRQMMSKTVTTATPSLTMTQIRTLKLSWPPINEQSEIETRLRSIDKKIDILAVDLNKKKVLKKGLMQDLLTGKVKVA